MTKGNPSNGNETKSDSFQWDIFKYNHISFYRKNIKVFQLLARPNFSVLWLKETHAMEMKQNETFFNGLYSKSDTISFFYQKKVKVFEWLSKSKFISFMTIWSQTMEMRQNRIFFHGTYSNLISFFIYTEHQFWLIPEVIVRLEYDFYL